MSTYNPPDSRYKRRSFPVPHYGLLYNIKTRIIPMVLVIFLIIDGSVFLAFSLNNRAVPRHFVIGTYTLFAILAVLFIGIGWLLYCRSKCAGKHDLRLEPEPTPVPETEEPGWDSIGRDYFSERPKQAPAVARPKRESTALGDLCDQIKQGFKNWLDEHRPLQQDKNNGRAKASTQASKRREAPANHSRHHHVDRRRENTAETEGMLTRWRKSYLCPSDSEMTDSEAEDLYRRQRDRDYRRNRDGLQRARQQPYCESDDNRSQDSDNTAVEPARAVLREEIHHYKLSPQDMEHVLNTRNLYMKLPDPAHNPRR
ncbi:hypothetical protein V490_03542 [Pseudogymnoascus sp. VKM F-3557]|nr:hypothetical protein V490_03542 [Pseudogymnoascus sp. VKM F-3557]